MVSMKLILVLMSTALAAPAFAQDAGTSYGMPPAQNSAWLFELKSVNKKQQLALIQERFFRQKTFDKSDEEDVPLLIIDGIPVDEQLDTRMRDFLAFQLTADAVEIGVLGKAPDGLYINKAWTGLIALNITDKKTRRRMNK